MELMTIMTNGTVLDAFNNTSSDVDANNLTMYVFDLGPKRDSLAFVIPITVIYAIIFITGLVGNVCTCAVIIRNRHMRTATNYYLFSLAVSDLLLLVMGLPQELYQLWFRYPYVFGEAFCILRGFTSEMSTNASILTITCFTTERYLAICHPIRAHTMSKLSRAVKLILAAWIVGSLSAVPMAIQFGVVFKEFEGRLVLDTAECTIKYPLQNAFASSTFCFFIIPMAIISVLYAMIGIELRKSESPSRVHSQKEPVTNSCPQQFSLKKRHLARLMTRQSTRSIRRSKVSSRKAVIKMLFAVVVAFFSCWAPFHGQRLMAIYVQHQTSTAVIVYTTLTHISGITYYLSATINPILYSIMSNKFREAFKDTLANCCRRNVHYDKTSSRYTSVLHKSSYFSVLKSSCGSVHNSSVTKYKRDGGIDLQFSGTDCENNIVNKINRESVHKNSFRSMNTRNERNTSQFDYKKSDKMNKKYNSLQIAADVT